MGLSLNNAGRDCMKSLNQCGGCYPRLILQKLSYITLLFVAGSSLLRVKESELIWMQKYFGKSN